MVLLLISSEWEVGSLYWRFLNDKCCYFITRQANENQTNGTSNKSELQTNKVKLHIKRVNKLTINPPPPTPYTCTHTIQSTNIINNIGWASNKGELSPGIFESTNGNNKMNGIISAIDLQEVLVFLDNAKQLSSGEGKHIF